MVQATEVARDPYPPGCQEHPRIRGDGHEPVSDRQAHRHPTISVHPILRLVFDRENNTRPESLRPGKFTSRTRRFVLAATRGRVLAPGGDNLRVAILWRGPLFWHL